MRKKNPQTTSATARTYARTWFLANKRGRMAALFIFALAVTAAAAAALSFAQSKKSARPAQDALAQNSKTPQPVSKDSGNADARSLVFLQDPSQPAQQQRQVPVLTLQNAPDIPQCHDVLRQDILDQVNAAAEDPAVTFENNRRLHPHMIEMPPTIECASGLWRAARRGGAPEAPTDPEIINQRQYSLESVFQPGGLAAAVGINVDPSNGVEGYQGENSIAIDPNNPQHIIAHSNTFFRDTTAQCQSPTGGSALTFGTMALFGSSDGGATWKYNCAPWHTSVTGGVTSANAYFGSDPALAWDAQGNAYACYMLISQNSSGSAGASIVVAKSTDVGQSWQQLGSPVVNRIGVTTSLDDKEMFTIDTTSGQAHSFPGRLYVIWDEGNVERIAHSDDGTTWTTVQPASNTGAIGGNLAIGADGTVYAVWTRYNVETIVFSKSTDGGTTWTAPAVISTNALQSFGSNNLPPAQDTRGINGFAAIDVDRNSNSAFFGNIYVSFTDFPSGVTTGADLNAYMIRSTNGGTTWSTRVKVNDDNWGASQFFPWLAVDQSDGSVNMSWIDSRIDPINRKTQMVYARSIDGGVSFEPNVLVNDGGANFRNNVNYSDENTADNTSFNGNQYGDYSGIAAFNRQVHPLWTDSREFFPVADTQSPTRREDNGTSVITNCSAPTAIAAPTVNSSTAPSVAVSWGAPTGWGTNATNGTYSVFRNTTSTFPGGSPLASGLTATNYVDTTGVNGTTYFYFVSAKNNCPGTALTPMSVNSTASASVVFGSAGTATGVLQGTVTSGGSAVSGIVVNAGTLSATTNASGFYQFPAINANTYTVSSSPAGYNPASVSGVVVTGGGTTVQNLSLQAVGSNSCFTDTSFSDFTNGTGSTVDIASSPGDVKLAHSGGEQLDQSGTDSSTSGNAMTNTTWWGETFVPAVSGTLTKLDVQLFCSTCSGTTSSQVVNIQATSGGLPTGAVLATATIPAFSSGVGTYYTVTFASPATVTAGTTYVFTVHSSTSISAGTYAVTRTSSNVYASGVSLLSSNSGSTWGTPSGASKDLEFHTYVTTPFTYPNPGNFTSSVKDSAAVVGTTATWGTLTWTNTALPSGTSIQFQAAGSNSASGPFNFVGPNGTSGTFFTTSGASLSQFNGLRYLKYKAFLATTNTANTPTLNDVTVCVNDVAPISTTLTAASATGTFGGTVNLSATLTDGTNGISGKTINFTLNGNGVGSGTTNGSGVATLSNVSLSGINAGSYPSGVGASFPGDASYSGSSNNNSLTVNKANQTITFNALADKTYGDANFNVSASASSGLSVSFNATGNCTVSGSTVHITGAGSCTITASQAGDSNYNAALNVQQSFQIAKANTTTSVTVSNAAYDGNPHGGTASVTGPVNLNQSLTVSYQGRNTTSYGPSNTAPTAPGDYTASASYAGDSNYNASSDSKDYQITKANQTITFNALADKTYGDPDFNVSASASSGLSVSFNASGNCTVSGSTVHITGAGSCTITASQAGDSNYNAAADVPRAFNIAKASQTITFAALADKTYGDADFNVSASASSGLSVSFGGTGNCTVTGSTVHITGAGSCTVTASQAGDSNYNAAADVPRSFNIAKADQTINFGALADKTYGDADFAVSASASSGLSVGFSASGNCTVSGSTVHITGAGSCTITASQAGDSNYNAAADVPQSFQIAKASATVTLGNLSQTYDGTPKSASATTNPAGLNVTFTYAPISQSARRLNVASGNPVNAGSYTVTATIDDPNYTGSASDTLVISKADATVSVSGYTGTYDGSAHGATGTATGAQGEDLSSLLDFGQTYTNVPGGTAHWTFNASNSNTNYNSSSGDVSITISKATPTVNWSNPADINYGTALSATQLNASASTAGSFAYTPAAGTVLSSGNGQTLHVAFTPSDTTNFNGASKDVSINVLTAALSVSMTADRNPAPVGMNFNYLVTITNNGNTSSTNTTLTDVLPSLVTFTAAAPSQGTCAYNSTTRAVTCSLGSIAPGSSVTVQITVKPRDEGTLNDTATVAAGQWDPATGNNSASVNGIQAIKFVDLSVSKTDSVDPIFIGDQTVYTITVKNSNTTINATGVTMQDSLPSGMTFVSATTTQGSLVTPPVGSTGIVTASIGTMAPNAAVTVNVTVKGAAAGAQTDTATVSANETDSNTSNNTATQTTTVKTPPTVTLQKVLLASQVLTGGCQNTTGQVYLTAPAPNGGVTVPLSSNISGASVPASVFIPGGQMVSPNFTVTTSPVTAKQVGLITAGTGSGAVSRGLTINVGSGTCN